MEQVFHYVAAYTERESSKSVDVDGIVRISGDGINATSVYPMIAKEITRQVDMKAGYRVSNTVRSLTSIYNDFVNTNAKPADAEGKTVIRVYHFSSELPGEVISHGVMRAPRKCNGFLSVSGDFQNSSLFEAIQEHIYEDLDKITGGRQTYPIRSLSLIHEYYSDKRPGLNVKKGHQYKSRSNGGQGQNGSDGGKS